VIWGTLDAGCLYRRYGVRRPGCGWAALDGGLGLRYLSVAEVRERRRKPGTWPGGRHFVEEPEQLNRYRHDQGAVALRGDLDHGLQQPQLQRGGVAGHHVGRCGQPLGGLVLAVGGDDPGPALTLGPGLPGHGPLHGIEQRDVFDLHPLDPDAPRALSQLIDDAAQLAVDRVPLREQLVHLGLADDRTQGRLRLLRDREQVVLHVHDRPDRVHHAEVDDRVHPDGHVVFGDAS
jgi:hypothetical protein